jgi:hypothetical protein
MQSEPKGYITETAQKVMPIHLTFMQEMPMPQYYIRCTASRTYRAGAFECSWFYKEISRCAAATPEESSEG